MNMKKKQGNIMPILSVIAAIAMVAAFMLALVAQAHAEEQPAQAAQPVYHFATTKVITVPVNYPGLKAGAWKSVKKLG